MGALTPFLSLLLFNATLH